MSLNSMPMIQQLRADFERLLTMVSGPDAHTATLDQMERCLLREVLGMGFKLLRLFVLTRIGAETHAPQLGAGGVMLPYHSQKATSYFSIFGKLGYERAYFYVPGQPGMCPLDGALSLPQRCYSDLLMESAELLGVDSAYDKGLRVLGRLLGLSLSESALETCVIEHSQSVKAYDAQQGGFAAEEEATILVAQADGKGVPMVSRETSHLKTRRGKGDKKTRKREAIAIALYTIEPYQRTAREVVNALFKKTAPPNPRPVPRHKQVLASLQGKQRTVARLAVWAARRSGEHIREQVALTDGAASLQNQIRAKLPGFTLVLDMIHVDEYLWKAGAAIYGETDPRRALWVETHLLNILSSRTDAVIQHLEETAGKLYRRGQAAKTLRQVASYYRRNLPYMDYAHYLRQGWPIGTGVIEGACRHLVKDRMELSGMRWTVSGAEALLALRSINENGDWDDFHQFRRTQRHYRLYGTPINNSWLNHVEQLAIN